jgi:hypothetical protein
MISRVMACALHNDWIRQDCVTVGYKTIQLNKEFVLPAAFYCWLTETISRSRCNAWRMSFGWDKPEHFSTTSAVSNNSLPRVACNG